MGNYSNDADSVRVDFFKESGKWYCTEAVKWAGPYHGTDEASGKITLIHDSFAHALAEHLGRQEPWRLEDMTAVCLEPYHEHSHPLMMRVNVAKQRWKEWNER
jgi:hypothetical protein